MSEGQHDAYYPTVIGISASVGGLALILATILIIVILRRRATGSQLNLIDAPSRAVTLFQTSISPLKRGPI